MHLTRGRRRRRRRRRRVRRRRHAPQLVDKTLPTSSDEQSQTNFVFLTFLVRALFLLFFGFRSIFVATFVEGQQQERPINN